MHMHAHPMHACRRSPHRDRRREVRRHRQLAGADLGADALGVVVVGALEGDRRLREARIDAAQQVGLLARVAVLCVGEKGGVRWG